MDRAHWNAPIQGYIECVLVVDHLASDNYRQILLLLLNTPLSEDLSSYDRRTFVLRTLSKAHELQTHEIDCQQ